MKRIWFKAVGEFLMLLVGLYLLIGFVRIAGVMTGDPPDPVPFLDAPWQWLASLLAG